MFCKKGVLKNFAKFTGKHLCKSLFLIKLPAAPATLFKKRLWHRYFPVNFAKFLRTPFLQKNSWATASEERSFFKWAPNKSVKTACVCTAFFFHYFKYYGQNIFSRITALYLTAKVERKEKTFYLKHEIILCQKKRESKCFRLRR